VDLRIPKKSGPDHRVPVISQAIFDNDPYNLPRCSKPPGLTSTS
jgi:hypothetical protein